LGSVCGLIAVLLIFIGIQIDVARVDLRIIPVAIAMLFGGFPSAIVAGIMIIGTRYFLTPVDQMEGFYLSTLIIVLIITTIGIVRRFVHVSTRHFQLLVSIGVLYSLPAIYILTNSWSTFFKISIAYIFFNLLAGFVAFRLLTELRRHFENIQYQQKLAMTDALTGLANRRRLDDSLSLVGSTDQGYSLVLIDIDFFKHVNDTYGHDRGDHILRQISALLTPYCPPSCVLGRFGGEEFMMLLPEYSLPETRRIAEQICDASATRTYELSATESLQVTLSIGVSRQTHQPSEIYNFLQTIQQADAALYQAKKSGRNCVFHHDPLR